MTWVSQVVNMMEMVKFSELLLEDVLLSLL